MYTTITYLGPTEYSSIELHNLALKVFCHLSIRSGGRHWKEVFQSVIFCAQSIKLTMFTLGGSNWVVCDYSIFCHPQMSFEVLLFE